MSNIEKNEFIPTIGRLNEEEEREWLLCLQKNHRRWFSQEEFDRLKELNDKLSKTAGLPSDKS